MTLDRVRQIVVLSLFLPMAFVSVGCSTSGSFFSEGHRLSTSAKEVRAAFPVPVAMPRELHKQLAPPYVVEPGDVLLIQPVKFDSPVRLPGDQPVFPDGTIHLGEYGQIIVAGKTIAEIEGIVQARVQAKTRDAGPITVRVVARESKVFYVLGEVNAPGAYPWNGRETSLDAIIAAGGLTDQASRKKIILSRPTPPKGCRVVLPICYYDIVQLGDTSTNYQIQAGDRIFVASRSFWETLFGVFCKETPPCGGPQTPCSVVHPGLEHDCSHIAPLLMRPVVPRYAPANVVHLLPPQKGPVVFSPPGPVFPEKLPAPNAKKK